MAITTSKVLLANMALLKLGKATITSLTEATDEAQKCNLIFDEIRMSVLAEGPWAFAIKRNEPGQDSTTPKYEFDYQHQLPLDFIRLLEINETVPGTYDHRIEGDMILSNITGMEIRYIADITNVNQWDPNFKTAFVLRLAAELSYYFRGDRGITELLFAQYRDAVDRGLALDGKQGSNETIVSTDLLEVR